MKKILLALPLFLVIFLGILIVKAYTNPGEDYGYLEATAKTERLNGFHMPGSTFEYMKMPGKYEDFDIQISFLSKEKNLSKTVGESLGRTLITPQDVVVQGIEYNKEEFKNFHLKNIKFIGDKGFKIYIPAGTVVTKNGYTLKEDFIIKDMRFVKSFSEIWPLVKNLFMKYAVWSLIGTAALIIMMILNEKVFGRSNKKLEFDKGILNMAVTIPACVFLLVLSGFFMDQLGRGTYENDIKLIVVMSVFLVPLGTLVVYKILVTLIHNIGSSDILTGTLIFFVQLFATFTLIYVVAVVTGLGVAGSYAIYKDENKIYWID